MKKIIALVLSIIMTFSVFAVPVSAQEVTTQTQSQSNVDDAMETVDEVLTDVQMILETVVEIIKIIHEFLGTVMSTFGERCPLCGDLHDISSESEEIVYTVCFNLNYDDAENNIPLQVVTQGSLVEVPQNVKREGYVFAGWHTSSDCTALFDFSTQIYKDYNLYARWVEITEDVNKDSDDDGLTDLEEDCYKTDINKKDTDGDGVSDSNELVVLYTDPLKKDTDGNGITDYEEDFDEDGIANGEEIIDGTNPFVADSDDDGLSDSDEKNPYHTNPLLNDTDSDGASDGWEITNGYDPLVCNESFSVEMSVKEEDANTSVSASVLAKVSGRGAETLSVTPVMAIEHPELNSSIAGFLGNAYEFNSEEPIESAEITFTYDELLGELGEDFQPRIYYYNETTGFLEELPNQKIEDGKVSAEVEHFSIYILLNKVEFDKVWESEIKPPEYEGSGITGIDVVFVVDSSGSMDWNDENNIRHDAVKQFINKLGENDRAAIIDFDNYAYIYQNFTNDKNALIEAINRVDSSGGTNLSNGMKAALNLYTNSAYTRTDAYKYVIFLTDGDGSYSSSYTTQAANNNVVVYTIGLGDEVEEAVLKSIAAGTNGKYYFASTASILPGIYDDVSFETIDYKSDTNNDGISDYYTKLIYEGKICSNTGSQDLEGIDLNFNANGRESADFDGDGLKNGEEIKIVHDETQNATYYYMVSDPTMTNSDCDLYSDSEEKKMGSNPMYNTYDGDAVSSLISSDYVYRSIVNMYDNDIVFKLEQNFFGYGLTDGFIGIAKEQIIDYMYDYVSEDYLYVVENEMLRISVLESLIKIIDEANLKIKTAKKIADKVQDAYEVISKATKIKVKAKELIGRINVLTASSDAEGTYNNLINLLEKDYLATVKDLEALDSTALGRVDIKLYDIGEKYKKFLDSKVVSDISISDTFTLAQLGVNIVDTMVTYAKINAITYVFEQNFDILQSIQVNAKYFEVATAAVLVSKALGVGYRSYVKAVSTAVTFDIAETFIDEVKGSILKNNPVYQGYKLAMTILAIFGGDAIVKTVYEVLCYSDMFDATAILANRSLERRQGNKTYGGYYYFYESRTLNDKNSLRYLKHLAQITILAEKAYIDFDSYRIGSYENENIPIAKSNIEFVLKYAEDTLKMRLPKSLGGKGNSSNGGGSR